jgi:hypothetical protein
MSLRKALLIAWIVAGAATIVASYAMTFTITFSSQPAYADNDR